MAKKTIEKPVSVFYTDQFGNEQIKVFYIPGEIRQVAFGGTTITRNGSSTEKSPSASGESEKLAS